MSKSKKEGKQKPNRGNQLKNQKRIASNQEIISRLSKEL
jgi:hypothetical protein